MSQLQSLSLLLGSTEFGGSPISPAETLDLVTGYDADQWPIFNTFSVGMRIVSPAGRLYKVIGFTKENTLICTQAGLDIDPMIAHVNLRPDGCKWADEPTYNYRHSVGLIEMAA